LLFEQRDELLLDADVAADAAVGVVQEARDSELFVVGRDWKHNRFDR